MVNTFSCKIQKRPRIERNSSTRIGNAEKLLHQDLHIGRNATQIWKSILTYLKNTKTHHNLSLTTGQQEGAKKAA